MGTVGKAMSLLDLFSGEVPEVGLSDLARRSGFDKATTRRLLVSLSQYGLVEQDHATRRYRLGAGLSRLARIREAHYPFLRVAVPLIQALAQETGETAHISEYSTAGLVTVHVEESTWANRVGVDVGAILPLHGTASGIAFLAHARPEIVDAYLARKLEAFTSFTLTAREGLLESMRAAAHRGYSFGDQGYEEGVFSVGAAVLGPDGYAVGALAVASPVMRVDDTVAAAHGHAVAATAREIARRLFGETVLSPRAAQAV